MRRPLLAAVAASLLLALGNWPAALVTLTATAVVALAAQLWAPQAFRRTLLSMFVAALIVRVAWACAIIWLLPQIGPLRDLVASDPLIAGRTAHLGITLFGDEWLYEQIAWGIAELWRTVVPTLASGQPQLLIPGTYLEQVRPPWGITAQESELYLLPHVYVVAALYTALGREPLAARTLQAVLGAALPILVFLLARAWFGLRTARVAGWIAVFEPGLIFWSPWLLKDTAAAGLVMAALLGALRLVRHITPGRLALLVGSLGVLDPVRSPVAIYLSLVLPVAAVAGPRWRGSRRSLALLLFLLGACVLWVAGDGFMGARRVNADLPFQIWYARVTSANGARTVIGEPADPRANVEAAGPTFDPLRIVNAYPRVPLWAVVESVGRSVAHLPPALVAVLGAPAPWSIERTQDRLALPLLPTWYAVVALGGFGLVAAWRRRWRLLALPATYLLLTLVYLSVTDSSVGIILRHRMMLLPVLLPFAAFGVLRLAGLRWPWRSPARGSLRVRERPL